MSFTVPQFNLLCDIWHAPFAPPGAPSASSICNLAFGRRTSPTIGVSANGEMQLLLPPGTDVRTTPQGVASPDIIEVPAGSGRIYNVLQVDDIGKGFPNEHRIAILLATGAHGLWPIPMP